MCSPRGTSIGPTSTKRADVRPDLRAQVVDAHVDAHLLGFDVSEDLGWQPGIGPTFLLRLSRTLTILTHHTMTDEDSRAGQGSDGPCGQGGGRRPGPPWWAFGAERLWPQAIGPRRMLPSISPSPESAVIGFAVCRDRGLPLVSGTTGWLNRPMRWRKRFGMQGIQWCGRPTFRWGSTCSGRPCGRWKKRRPRFRPSITETHHTGKVDASAARPWLRVI